MGLRLLDGSCKSTTFISEKEKGLELPEGIIKFVA
jgi:hypothetical protein